MIVVSDTSTSDVWLNNNASVFFNKIIFYVST